MTIASPLSLKLRLPVAAALFAASVAIPAYSADFRLEKSFTLASGDRFVLDSDLGGVTLRGVEGSQASILVTSDREDLATLYDFKFDQAAGQLKMKVERRHKGVFGWFDGFHGTVRIEVQVPRATPVDLDTSGGGIDIADLTAQVTTSSSGGAVAVRSVHGAVHLESSGGGVSATDIDGTAYADSSGGSVKLERVTGDIEASSSGGGVHIEDAGGRVKADSSGGPVKVRFAAGNSKGGDLDSSGGGVVATVDSAIAVDIDASSSGGSVHCNVPVTIQGRISSDSVRGKLNGGGAMLRLRSSGGGITIESR